MSFRVIEKRDDGTTLAVLDNNPKNYERNESSFSKTTTKISWRPTKNSCFNRYSTKNENEKRSLIIKPNQKEIKSTNTQETKTNHINKSSSNTLQTDPIVTEPTTLLPNISARKLNTSQTPTDSNETQTEKPFKRTNNKRIEKNNSKTNKTFSSNNNSNVDFSLSTPNIKTTQKQAILRPKAYQGRKLLPPRHPSQANKITLVLDLDETLVHSVFLRIPKCDFSFMTDPLHFISVCVRPGVKDFIQQIGTLYELVLFTVGNNVYAARIIDFIDPQRMIKYRLFRDSCTISRGNFVKDLSKLGRDLSRVIILDDSPTAYMFQPENALPITSWIGDPNDNELSQIRDFLVENHQASDVYNMLSEYRLRYMSLQIIKKKK